MPSELPLLRYILAVLACVVADTMSHPRCKDVVLGDVESPSCALTDSEASLKT